ncbi:unnamed protein product [Pocillopora meandrina]|uniref:MYND-type domain-containing protein n=1 Tax=Pocillopora meandrina TaxID=46732 RepID=A0AAU9W3Q2_9CNID|nr:unnamed protein product [Pocillopora meandrina]
MAAKEVELGFAEEIGDDAVRKLQMTSAFFPSKIGGTPAWLNLLELPNSSCMVCKICLKPMAFLLQVYAPMPHDQSFHRTIFVFCCKDGNCHSKNYTDCFLVLRNQLKRDNKFYSYNPPPELDEINELSMEYVAEEFKPKTWISLCDVCGCKGDKKCSKCHVAQYCGREHQTVDWKSGHKNLCPKLCAQDSKEQLLQGNKCRNRRILFPEYELLIETEPVLTDENEKSEKDRLDEYKQFVRANELFTDTESDKELESLASLGKEALLADKQFRKFKKRITREPKQVLRYHQNGEPLWVSDEGKPSEDDIPRCDCGSERVFEFQIMPQLLNHLQVDSLEESVDWGTLVVYTCAQSCGDGSSYQTEFIWKQNFADTGIPTTALGTG